MKPFPIVPFLFAVPLYGAVVGGNVGPDGREIQNDLPANQHTRNVSSRGQGWR